MIDQRESMHRVASCGWRLGDFGEPRRIARKILLTSGVRVSASVIASCLERGTDFRTPETGRDGADGDGNGAVELVRHDSAPVRAHAALAGYLPSEGEPYYDSPYRSLVDYYIGEENARERPAARAGTGALSRRTGAPAVASGAAEGREEANRGEKEEEDEEDEDEEGGTRKGTAQPRSSPLNGRSGKTRPRADPTVCAVVHLGQPSMWPEMEAYLDNLDEALESLGTSADVCVTVRADQHPTEESLAATEEMIRKRRPWAVVISVENRGQDVGAWIAAIACILSKEGRDALPRLAHFPATRTESQRDSAFASPTVALPSPFPFPFPSPHRFPFVSSFPHDPAAPPVFMPFLRPHSPYRYVVKFHTKTDTAIRRDLIAPLVGTKEDVLASLRTFSENPDVGIIGAQRTCFRTPGIEYLGDCAAVRDPRSSQLGMPIRCRDDVVGSVRRRRRTVPGT